MLGRVMSAAGVGGTAYPNEANCDVKAEQTRKTRTNLAGFIEATVAEELSGDRVWCSLGTVPAGIVQTNSSGGHKERINAQKKRAGIVTLVVISLCSSDAKTSRLQCSATTGWRTGTRVTTGFRLYQ